MTEPPIIDQPIASGPSKHSSSNDNIPASVPGSAAVKKKSLLDEKWFVLAAIFLAMMFLGIPLLWRCPAFSRTEKLVWTVLTLIYSALLFWIFYSVMAWIWRNITEAL